MPDDLSDEEILSTQEPYDNTDDEPRFCYENETHQLMYNEDYDNESEDHCKLSMDFGFICFSLPIFKTRNAECYSAVPPFRILF